jgi:hypothetical protein
MRVIIGIAVIVVIASLSAASAQIVKREPPMGQLKPRQTILVDDGSCPNGQIKRVVGGDHVDAGGRGRVLRTRDCVQRK